MPVLSDADMGITGESAAPLPRGRVLSDADMGIAPQTSVASVTKSAGAGVVRGALGAAGVGGGVREYNASALSRLLKAAGYDVPVETISKGLRVLPIMNAPSSKELTGATESVTGPLYEPQTTAEKVAHTVGEFVPAVLGGEGNLVRRLATNVIAPALASETAGELTKGSAFEPYARAGAAVLTPFAGGAASRLTGARTTTAPRFVKNVAGVDVPT